MSLLEVFRPLLLACYPLVGLAVGSFLNVCIWRIPRGESVVRPGSHCPTCGQGVHAYDNVPLLSFLWLKGRCRSCKARISGRYPLVELLTGLAFWACAVVWEFSGPTFVNSLFLAVVLILVFIDHDHQILPNVLTLPGVVAGVLLSPLQSRAMFRDAVSFNLASFLWAENPDALLPWAGSLLGALVGGGSLFLVGFAYQVLRKRQGLGMGDMKMMAMVGAFLGWRLAFLTIFSASLLGSIAGIALILLRRGDLQTKLAFGTYVGCGAALSLFLGIPFLCWFTRPR